MSLQGWSGCRCRNRSQRRGCSDLRGGEEKRGAAVLDGGDVVLERGLFIGGFYGIEPKILRELGSVLGVLVGTKISWR